MTMLDFITERVNSWDRLRMAEEPIFIYGMGNGAEKILKVFEQYHIPVAGFFASDDFVRGHSFKGHLVHTLGQIESLIDDFIVVLAFGAGYESIYERIKEIAKRHTLIAPDVPVVGEGLFTYEYAMEHAREIQAVYDMLADERSRRTFADVLNFRISGDIKYLDRCTAGREETHSLINFRQCRTYIDMGAYNGDTVLDFLRSCGGEYDRIIAIEPDERSFRKLQKTCDERHIEDITLINAAAWSEDTELEFSELSSRGSHLEGGSSGTKPVRAVKADSIAESADLIKLDVEGAEAKALKGAEKLIGGGASVVCALYHRAEDMFALPLMIHEMAPDARLYIRHKLYIPAWETNLYAVNQ